MCERSTNKQVQQNLLRAGNMLCRGVYAICQWYTVHNVRLNSAATLRDTTDVATSLQRHESS